MSTLRWLVIAALAGFAGRAEAQVDHSLVAQTGGGCAAETSEDIHVDSVQRSCGSGVGGVDANWFANDASANSATGHLNVTALIGLTDPPASFDPDSLDTVASIRERLTPTGLGPIRAMLQISTGIDTGGAVVRYEVTLQLTTSCMAFLSQYAGNGFIEDADIVLSCSSPVGSAIGDGNSLAVTLDDPGSTVDLLAQVRAEWFNFGSYPPTGGSYAINVDLWVLPLEGADYTAPSPNFLTQVPEPEESLLGLAALAAMGWIAKRRRC